MSNVKAKRVFKYATGEEIPESAVYLRTVVQTIIYNQAQMAYVKCWLVWHYFLVEAEG